MSMQVRIRERLEAIGMSASQASLAAGLSRSSISAVLRGNSESPRVATIVALAPVLGCSLQFLIEGSGDVLATDDASPSLAGISLRDWFAGHAVSGLLADNRVAMPWTDFAIASFAIADAMIAHRTQSVPS